MAAADFPLPIFNSVHDASEYLANSKAYDAEERLTIRKHESTIEEMKRDRTLLEEKIKSYEQLRKLELSDIEREHTTIKSKLDREQLELKTSGE
jgi:DNA-directed RNA polymerase beta subunit